MRNVSKMGIKNLNKFLKKHAPQIFREVHLSEYKYKRVAIDVSLFVCKFKILYGDQWITSIINLISCLRKNDVHCVFIYDSGCPDEKLTERALRRQKRNDLQSKISTIEKDIKMFKENGIVSDYLRQQITKRQNSVQLESPKRLLSTTSTIDVSTMEFVLTKMKKQVLSVSDNDFKLTKELLKILDVPFHDAPLEAETMCADLCKRKLVDAVLTDDSDVIAYGAPIILSKINIANSTVIQVTLEDILEALEINYEMLLDFCILCGTDYNKNINLVGPEKAFKLIQIYNNIEGIAQNRKIDISVLTHEKVRCLFKDYKISDTSTISYCGTPNYDKLSKFAFENNLRLDLDYVKSCFSSPPTLSLE